MNNEGFGKKWIDRILGKVDKDQGVANAGKVLGIGADGQVTPVEQSGGGSSGRTEIDISTPELLIANLDNIKIGDIFALKEGAYIQCQEGYYRPTALQQIGDRYIVANASYYDNKFTTNTVTAVVTNKKYSGSSCYISVEWLGMNRRSSNSTTIDSQTINFAYTTTTLPTDIIINTSENTVSISCIFRTTTRYTGNTIIRTITEEIGSLAQSLNNFKLISY